VAWIEPRKDSKFTVRYRDGYGRAAKKLWRVFATETEAREFKRRADAIEMHARNSRSTPSRRRSGRASTRSRSSDTKHHRAHPATAGRLVSRLRLAPRRLA